MQRGDDPLQRLRSREFVDSGVASCALEAVRVGPTREELSRPIRQPLAAVSRKPQLKD